MKSVLIFVTALSAYLLWLLALGWGVSELWGLDVDMATNSEGNPVSDRAALYLRFAVGAIAVGITYSLFAAMDFSSHMVRSFRQRTGG